MLCEGEIESELVLIPDEAMLIKSIDQKQITSWADFEYILTVIVENRLLRLYQAHLDQQYRLGIKDDLQELMKTKKQKKRKRNVKKIAEIKLRDKSA